MSEFILYVSNTANGYKSLIPLEEFACDYEMKTLDLPAGEQYQPKFMKLSPLGRIPVLETSTDGSVQTIYGTEAIAIFLAERYGKFLEPVGEERYKTLEMTSMITSDIALPMAVQFQVDILVEGEHPAVIEYFSDQARRLYGNLDSIMQERPWLAGDDYTIADMLAYPAVAISALRIPGMLNEMHALNAWAEKVGARPAVKAAMAQLTQ